MISIVIPLLNEEGTLEQLHHELSEVASARGYDLQIIFIDDGSRDGSWKIIERLATADPRVLGIRFRRNFGKAAALSAGFDAAQGESGREDGEKPVSLHLQRQPVREGDQP